MKKLFAFCSVLALLAPMAASAQTASYGTLNPAGGGFPADLWAKSDGRLMEKLLALLPETVLSPSTHELVRRALLTMAPAPSGIPDIEFLEARAVALAKMGDASDAAALLHAAPGNNIDQATARQVIDAAFYADAMETACLDVRSDVKQYADPYWKRALVVCELAAGQRDQAAADLQSALAGDDADFTTMAQAVMSGSQPPEPANPTTLDVALLRLARAAMPASLITSEDVVKLGGVARTESVAASTRVETGYEAAAQSAFGINEMLALYRLPGAEQAPPAGQTIGRDDFTQSMAVASHRDAGLVQAVEAAKDSGQRVQLLNQLLTTDADYADVPYFARVELLRVVSITSDRSSVAAAAARGFLLEGDVPAAQRWYDMAKTGPEAKILWPLGHIAFSDLPGKGNPAELQSWVNSELADKDNGPKRVERVLAVLEALGETVPSGLWEASIDKPDDESSIMGSAAISSAMASAAQQGERGAVILLIALSLKDGPGHAHPLNLNHAVAALRHVGLENPARAIALEGLAPVTTLK
jgi:hypothetical protein